METSNIWQTLLAKYTLLQPKPDSDYLDGLCISPLSYQRIFSLYGPDSEKFLQGQLSCDLREVKTDGSRLGAHCNPKGSMLSLMRVSAYNDDFLIKVNSDNFEDTISHLKKYMMFSKAQIEDLSSNWVSFGIYGKAATDYISRHFPTSPKETNNLTANDQQLVIKVTDDRFEIWLSIEAGEAFLKQIAVESQTNNNTADSPTLLSSDYWLQQEIVQVIPDIYPLSSANYIPQMCNLQALQGVSFKKGCYTGQEVITRLHFRGKLNKYLITAKAKTDNLDKSVFIDCHVHCEDRENIGKVLQWVTIEDSTYIQLVVNAKYADEPLLISNELPLEALPQPYTLDPSLFVRKD